MDKQNENLSENIKPDLKHDSMEYAASADGEDKLDMDDIIGTDEENITAEELNLLEEDNEQGMAAALVLAESDSLNDADNFINEKEDKDEYEDTDQGDEEKDHPRK